MPTTRVSRVLDAAPEAVWALVDDPHHQPRWWPRVRRVEGVSPERFTQVLGARSGKGIRADFTVAEREPGRRVVWAQELAGSPFERLVEEAVTTVVVEPAGDGATHVALELRRRLRGWSKLAPFLYSRAARVQLGEALDGLEAIAVRD